MSASGYAGTSCYPYYGDRACGDKEVKEEWRVFQCFPDALNKHKEVTPRLSPLVPMHHVGVMRQGVSLPHKVLVDTAKTTLSASAPV